MNERPRKPNGSHEFEAELRALRRLSGALLRLDAGGRILEANPAALDLLRRNEKEVLGCKARFFLTGGERFLPPSVDPLGSADALPPDRACRLILPDGSLLPVHCCLTALDATRWLLRLSSRSARAIAPIFADTSKRLHSYLDQILTLSGELSLEGRFLSLESSMLAKGGFDESFFLDKNWRDFPWFGARPESEIRIEERIVMQ